MGEGRKATTRLQSDSSVRLTFHGATITSNAGPLTYRELDNAFGLTDIAEHFLHGRSRSTARSVPLHSQKDRPDWCGGRQHGVERRIEGPHAMGYRSDFRPSAFRTVVFRRFSCVGGWRLVV
jgi:hypothetical protein